MQPNLKDCSRFAICYLNGHFCHPDAATVSVQERAFQYGDAVFETMRVSASKVWRWSDHRSRLEQALLSIGIDVDLGALNLSAQEVITRNKAQDALLRIHISRGKGGRGYAPPSKESCKALTLIELFPLPASYTEPVDLLVSQWRNIPSECMPSNVKSFQALQGILVRQEAEARGCVEGLKLTLDHYVAEGVSSNIFWVTHNQLYTPSLKCGIFPGMMRKHIIENTNAIEGVYSLEAVLEADEVFLTNVAWPIVSVKSLLPHQRTYRSFEYADRLRQSLIRKMNCASDVGSHIQVVNHSHL